MIRSRRPPRDPHATATRHPMLASKLPAWRSKLIVFITFSAFAALAGRALWVQVVNHDFYVKQGQKRYQRTLELDAMRGRIVDRNGAILAVSLETFEIWANPKILDAAAWSPLAKLLDMP
ncbi:MAG: penicillin-binding protein 2, partial [Paraburkholderia tropica]